MGSWGTGLYQNDIAMDLRDEFNRVKRAPWDGAALLEWAASQYPLVIDPSDDDYTDVRLVLADLFWTHGVEHRETMEVARRIIADGADLAVKRALGMSDRYLRHRAQTLDALAQKWRGPNPKPRPRRVLAYPQPYLFEEGDCIVYPTANGEVHNPYAAEAAAQTWYKYWRADGWGAAIVLARYRVHTVFACYAIAVLATTAAERLGVSDFPGLSILHTEPMSFAPEAAGGASTPQIHPITMSRQHRQRMRIDVVGRLPVNRELVAAEVLPRLKRQHWDNSLANAARFGAVGARLVPASDPVARYLLDQRV